MKSSEDAGHESYEIRSLSRQQLHYFGGGAIGHFATQFLGQPQGRRAAVVD
jgi:hypothetical protein